MQTDAPSIPSCSPSFFKGPFIFYNREYFIIPFRTTAESIRKALPFPLEPIGDDIVLYEFMNMPDSPGLGSYSESGILIPCRLNGVEVNYTAQMYLDCEPAIFAGREIWGFPKKRGNPSLKPAGDTLVGELVMNGMSIAFGTMPYKAEPLLPKHAHTPERVELLMHKLTKPQVNLKIIPRVDGSDGTRQLIQYQAQVIRLQEAWQGPARLHLVPHVDADVADFPILETLKATHILADIILPYGNVVFDYMSQVSTPVEEHAKHAFVVASIPMGSPSYSRSVNHVFYHREHFVVTCETTAAAVRSALPEPLEPVDNLVTFSFMNMKDSPGFGSYTETSVRVNCRMKGQDEVLSFVQQVFSDSSSSQYGGRELWGLPMKRGVTVVAPKEDTLVATMHYGDYMVAMATMPYKAKPLLAMHEPLSESRTATEQQLIKDFSTTRVSLKIIPEVDGKTKERLLVTYRPQVLRIYEAWHGSARIHLIPHVNAPLADFPILRTTGAIHFACDMILPMGETIYNYDA